MSDSNSIALPPCEGHATLEICNLTTALEEQSIPSCIVGVSALMFYGALRVRDAWHVCVPDAKLLQAVEFLSQRDEYVYAKKERTPQPMSLAHTYYWFTGDMGNYEFCLVPSTHARIDVGKSLICRSSNGVPYPLLEELVQSFLDTNDYVSLCDVVDGTDLGYDWGEKYLNLDGNTDVDWALQLNTELMGGEGRFNPRFVGSLYPTVQIDKKGLWKKTTDEKQQRLEQALSPDLVLNFRTRFMHKSSMKEPWNEPRDAC